MRAVLIALAMSVVVPAAFADHGTKSLADCTAFGQEEKGDDAVAFSIHNGCSVPVDCAVSWKVICAPDSKKRRSTHAQTAKLALADGGDAKAEASAAICKDDSWQLMDVEWSCSPNKD